jgi:ABC-2 type transport system permease protein
LSFLPRTRAVWAMVRRDYRIARRSRFGLLIEFGFGVVNLLIYFYISRALSDPTTAELSGAESYFEFAAVGVSLAIVIQAASVGVARRLREERLTGTLEAVAAAPVSHSELAFGIAAYPFLFAALRAGFYLLIAALMLGLDLGAADPLGVVAVLATTTGVLMALGMAVGALGLVLRRSEGAVVLATVGLVVLGGAYFPISILPDAVVPVAEVMPTHFAFTGLREALLQGQGWGEEALLLLAMTLVFLPAALLGFRAALRLAKQRGSLSQA